MKQRKRILKTVSSIALITSAATLNLRAATTFYVDSAWKGTPSGTPSQPWRYLSSSAWLAINRALESDDVTVYFPARQATSDSEAVYDSTGDGVQDGIDLTRRTDTSKSALRLDANSLYNRSETAPDWAVYSGNARCKVRYLKGQNSAHVKHSNITIHGFHVVTTDGNKEITICGDNWVVEDCECEHAESASDGPGILLVPTSDSGHEGSSAYAPPCDHIIIRNNIVHDTDGEALYIGGGGVMEGDYRAGYPSHSNVTIENNRIYNAGTQGGQGDGIDVKGGIRNLIIRGNEIYHLNSRSGVRAIVLQGQLPGASQSTVIEGNWIHHCQGIEDGAITLANSWGLAQGVSIRNNVIDHIDAAGIKIYDSQDTVQIYNNTISACDSVGIVSHVRVSVLNNLIFGNNDGGSQVSLSRGAECDFNAYSGEWGYSPAGGSSLRLSAADLLNTVADAASADYSLKSGSPVMGRAKVLSGFSNDVMNNPRGSSWDIGAIQASGAGENIPRARLDSTAPSGAITAPADTATVSGSVIVLADASDNVGVVGVQFTLDGSDLGSERMTAPYRLSWDTTLMADGPHSLAAVVRDAAGNRTMLDPVTVVVSQPEPSDAVWVDDGLPAGALTGETQGDEWNWKNSDPTPYSGSVAHQSVVQAGTHQHFFYGASLPVDRGDTLYVYVYLDPQTLPSEVMLEWSDDYSWNHRAYWGANLIRKGRDGTASRRYMGPLPLAGEWVRLEVPARLVGLEAITVSGMSFTLYNGGATLDVAGKIAAAH